MTQYEVIYQVPGSKDTWHGKPGKLYLPAPTTTAEVMLALLFILEKYGGTVVTVTRLTD